MSKSNRQLLLECECHGYHFVKIYYDEEWGTTIDHIEQPRYWKQKLECIWKIIKGQEIFSGDLIVKKEDYKRLAKFFKEMSS